MPRIPMGAAAVGEGRMKSTIFQIENIPAVLYGEDAERVFLFVHGQCGNKEEGERFAHVAAPYGYQVLAVDLPEHGGRSDGAKLVPWEVVPELQRVIRYAKTRWEQISVRAISIGAWFSLLSFAQERVEQCLLSSPLTDMEGFIRGLMLSARVTEEQLRAAGEIKIPGGQTLSYPYLCFAREHPVCAIGLRTAVLYATGDRVIPRASVDRFVGENRCALTIIEGGEHWIHLPCDVEEMRLWEVREIERGNQRNQNG